MEPKLKFSISNQRIYRDDNFHVVAGSKNYLTASFEFKTPEWDGKTKTAVFYADKPYSVVLVNDTCDVPWEFTAEPGIKYVSVFAGDLITANKAKVEVWESGYIEGETPKEPTPTVYEQIIALLESKADGLSYADNILKLLSGEEELARVTITGGGGGGREIELQKGETAIQWRYTGDTEWNDLVALVDITGPSGTDGQDGKDGQPGTDGITPHIGENGNWYLGDTDTGKPSRGETGPAGQDGAPGEKGEPGEKGDPGPQGEPGQKGETGEPGQKGETGEPGADGKSAYQYAKEGGYTGTEDEFRAKLAKEYAEPIYKVAMTADDIAPALDPGKKYDFPDMTSLAYTLAPPSDSAEVAMYWFGFGSPADTATTVTHPEGVTVDGPTIAAGKRYEVQIADGLAIIKEWEAAS